MESKEPTGTPAEHHQHPQWSKSHMMAARSTFPFLRGRSKIHGLGPLILVSTLVVGLGCAGSVSAAPVTDKPRAMMLSDIGNEPDDQMSLVRLMLYSNEIDIRGLIATTSTWQRDAIHPETMHQIVAAYGQVRPNLLLNAPGWPTADEIDKVIFPGQPKYGLAATGPDKDTQGSNAIVAEIERDDPRPLWICLWGGANTLAQALQELRAKHTADDADRLIAKLRVYSISDQDDAGPWIRREFPKLSYIVMPSQPDASDYGNATWTGISGDVFYGTDDGADSQVVTNDWLDQNVRSKGPLGQHYPKFIYIMEGDTPSYLGLIQNGLDSDEDPSWGGWGGRYVYRQPYGESHAIWTQSSDGGQVTSRDLVTGADGRSHYSDQATIWRWRDAYQNDFSARMDWTIKPYAQANHVPIAVVNGIDGKAPVHLSTEVGQSVTLDATGSHDPDNNKLTLNWFHYKEAGFEPGACLADVDVHPVAAGKIKVTAVATSRAFWRGYRPTCKSGVAHLILEVTDDGTPALTSYRRVILTVLTPAPH